MVYFDWYNKGNSFLRSGKFEDASRCYDEALKLYPLFVEAWLNKGTSLLKLSRPSEAIRCYDRAIDIDPRCEAAWINKGTCLRNSGKFEEAFQCFDKVLEINPRSEAARTNKENCLHDQQICNIATELIGIKITGEVKQHVKGEAYKINLEDEFIVCLKQPDGWIITLFGNDEKSKVMWSNIPSEQTKIGIQIIDLLIQVNGQSVHPRFKKERLEEEQDVGRKTYTTDIGPIILHTRRHPQGTEIVIQIVKNEVYLRCVWEQRTGSIDLRNVQKLQGLPF